MSVYYSSLMTQYSFKVNVKNITTIKCALRCFELTSGLKLNFGKSKISRIGVQNTKIQRYFVILNCNLMQVPFKNLGVPVEDNHKRKLFWNYMILKHKSKIISWKGKHLSFVGKVTLLKFVLSVVPLYYLSLFKILIDVVKIITRMQRDFL